jgi:carbamoyltransferase
MYILGISSGLKLGHHDGAAVLIKNGKVIFAAEEERFILSKHARSELPKRTILHMLKKFKISIKDISYVCSPLKTYPNYQKRLEKYFKFNFGYSPEIVLFDHHYCHAASAYFPSGFEDAIILCADNSGDSSSGGIFSGKKNNIKRLESFSRENSLGLYYGMITQYLGFQMTKDEYKVMGLSSYGKNTYENLFNKILRFNKNFYKFNNSLDIRRKNKNIFTTDFSTRQEQIFTDELENILGPRRIPGSKLNKRFINIAASAQKKLEDVLVYLVNAALKNIDSKNLCLAGGVALNCKANMEIANRCDIKKLYIPSAPNDAGVALGAALLHSEQLGIRTEKIDHVYLGSKYGNSEIFSILKNNNINFSEVNEPYISAGKDILKNKIVGWFNGKMEFGPRALGARSILANPSSKKIKDKINSKIKYREEFRPFCPSVLEKNIESQFIGKFASPFMNLNMNCKNKTIKSYPSIAHVDGTARVQSVSKVKGQDYYELLNYLDKNGIKSLLNTSLNINEQPLVNTPIEALQTFFCSGLDILYLENFKIKKNNKN